MDYSWLVSAFFGTSVDTTQAFLGAIFGGLAGLLGLGKVGTAVATGVGGLLGNRLAGSEDRREARKDYENQRDMGFTHSEIAGSGGAGSDGTFQSVMGNQHNQFLAQQRQMEYETEQRALDRAVAVRGQDAGIQAAEMSSGAQIYGSNVQAQIAEGQLALAERRFDNIELPKGLNDIITSSPDWKRQEILARMAPDNAIATLMMNQYKVNILDPDQVAAMPQEEFRRMVRDIRGLQSTIFRETTGAVDAVRGLGNRVRGAMDDNLATPQTDFLGSGSSRPLTRSPLEGLAR